MMSIRPPGSPIAWPLRAWIGVEIFFGVAAMATIAYEPADSARHFAWPIKPVVTAALLGAFYMSSAWVFALAVFAKRWEMIRAIMIPAILFTFIELVVTFLHWDRFKVGSTPFNVWFASYLLPPPILAACYWWQRGRAIPRTPSNPITQAVRIVMIVLGVMLLAEGLIALFAPQTLIGAAPWTFTPLTARALSGWLVLLGSMLLSVAWENDRDRARIVSPFFLLLPPSVAWQLSRYSGEVNWSHPQIVSGGVVLGVIFLIGAYLARGDWRTLFR